MKLKNKAILALALSMSFVMASNSLAAEPDAGSQPGAQASEPAAPAEGGAQAPGEGGTQAPGEGGTQAPGEGGTQAPGEGGTQAPEEGGNENPTSGQCKDPEVLKKEFEDAINPMFDGISEKEGVYKGTFDKDKREVTVEILDKTQGAKELSGTGLATGLEKLYKNNHLVKIKVGSQKEKDLKSLIEAAPGMGMTDLQMFKFIFGTDLLNEVQKTGEKTGKLADFIDKTVELKLTIKEDGEDCPAQTITYIIKGIGKKDGKVPPKGNPDDKKPQPKPSDDYNYDFYLPSIDDKDENKEEKEESKDDRSDEELAADIEKTDKEINDVLDKNEEKKKEENKEKEEEKKPSKEKESDVENKKKKSKAATGKKGNPKTGVASVGYLGGLAAISMAGIVAFRKRK